MVRVYKRKTSRCDIRPDAILAAAKTVIEGGKSIRSQAKDIGVSPMTLCRYIKKIKERGYENISIGYDNKQQVFTKEQEEQLTKYIVTASKIYFGLSPVEVRVLAYECAKGFGLNMPATWEANTRAGTDWLSAFMRRNPRLSIRVPEATSMSRASSFNRNNVSMFFSKLKTVMDKYNIHPHEIWNVDETGITTVQKPRVIVAEKGIKQVGSMTSGERGSLVTLCCAVSASGIVIPPMFIFPRTHFKDHFVRDGPVGCIGSAHPSGWMTKENFYLFLKHFVEHVKPKKDKPVLLLLDNHHSHIAVDVLNYAKENGIVMMSFPPHCSHKLQPLDRTVFGPLKRNVATAMDGWMRSNPGKCLTIYNIPSVVREAWPKATLSSNVISGFEVSGIYPFNEQIFTDDDFAPSFVTDRPSTDDSACVKPNQASSSDSNLVDNSASVKNSQIPQEIDGWKMIGTELQNKGLELIPIRGDGHCLLKAFLTSFTSEGLGEVEHDQICQNISDEAEKHADYYQKFVTEGNQLKDDVRNYIQDKQYNRDTVDLMLNMICNSFCVTAVVYQLHEGKLTEMSHPPGRPGVQSRGRVYLVLHGERETSHYNTVRKLPVLTDCATVAAETSTSNEHEIPQTPAKKTFTPESVRPLPKAKPRSMDTKGRKKRKCAILTDTPEKATIEKEQLQKESRDKKTKRKSKQKPRNAPKKKAKLVESSDDEEEWYCLVCIEPFSNSKPREKWLKCVQCCEWAHAECTNVGLSKGRVYVCQNCDSDGDFS